MDGNSRGGYTTTCRTKPEERLGSTSWRRIDTPPSDDPNTTPLGQRKVTVGEDSTIQLSVREAWESVQDVGMTSSADGTDSGASSPTLDFVPDTLAASEVGSGDK
ncbi:hypothetical protein NDU88_001356 [Pleurodeles waltl]|uniref:Uncharacterized protein n=1 Tax=Pleurodeles waltl TaxID=8319 RepID=A0AAV7VBN6_PLEWA|nr:hypothetical protein NDU88_001356 [Pleurodeles waltl]